MVLPDTDVFEPADLMTRANALEALAGRPYRLASYMASEVVDRGAYAGGVTYNPKEQVTFFGFTFVATETTSLAPLDNTGSLQAGWAQEWLSAYHRLRYNLLQPFMNSGSPEYAVSGPWPCQAPSVFYRNQAFYYPDTGQTETVSVGGALTSWAGTGRYVWVPFVQLSLNGSAVGNVQGPRFITRKQYSVIIGGAKAGRLTGDFFIDLPWAPGFDFQHNGYNVTSTSNVDTSNPLPLVTVTSDLPGTRNTYLFDRDDAGDRSYKCVTVVFSIDQDVTPGRYEVVVEIASPGDDYWLGQYSGRVLSRLYIRMLTSYLGQLNSRPFGSITAANRFNTVGVKPVYYGNSFSTTVDVPGVHSTKAIKAIGFGDYAPQVLLSYWFPTDANYSVWPPEKILSFGPSAITASTVGFWFGQTYPIQNLGMQQAGVMPWNQFVLPDGTGDWTLQGAPPYRMSRPYRAYANGSNYQVVAAYSAWESETMPPVRKDFTWYPLGFQVQDANGNLQTCIQEGITGGDTVPHGYFSGTAPFWPVTLGAEYTEVTTTGSFASGQPYYWARALPAKWRLTKLRLPIYGSWQGAHAYAVRDRLSLPNGNAVEVLTPGVSGAAAPAWPATVNATVTDGTVVWKVVALLSLPVAPAGSRRYAVPAYPCIWDNDSWQPNQTVLLGQLLRDTNGEIRICSQPGKTGATQPNWGSGGTAATEPQVAPRWGMVGSASEITDGTAKWRAYLAGFAPRGWWIYRIATHRLNAATTPLTCAVGIYRNGAFVALGTFAVGGTAPAMWPVFTNTPLVYQCAERIEVVASFITCGNNFTSGSGPVGYPLAAAFYNDVESFIARLEGAVVLPPPPLGAGNENSSIGGTPDLL